MRVGELKGAAYNPRVELKPGMPGYERLARSLREFDLVQPIVWNERTGHVVSGHQRLSVLKNEGVEEVDVAVVSLPLEREKALNVALNNPRVGGDWDAEKLIDLMEELEGLPEFDVTLTGFDQSELRDLVLEPQRMELEDDDEEHVVRVVLEVEPERWEEVREELDEVIGRWGLDAKPQARLREQRQCEGKAR